MAEEIKDQEKQPEKEEKTPVEKSAESPIIRLPKSNELLVSSSPHLHDSNSIQGIMLLVMIALMPACLAGIYFFGFAALKVIIYCVVFCVAIEIIWCWAVGRPTDTWKDGTAVVTGIILAMNLASGVPWWLCLIGGFLAIGLGKQLYGGLGYNPFNPAIVARVGLLIGLPTLMTTWVPDRQMPMEADYQEVKLIQYDQKDMTKAGVTEAHIKKDGIPFYTGLVDGVTCATPLGEVKVAVKEAKDAQDKKVALAKVRKKISELTKPQMYWNYFWGNMPGCLGETSAFALLIGGIFLIFMKLIRWQVPVAYIGTVALFTGIVHGCDPTLTPDALFHVLTGGLMLGAFFCATDMVTSPMTGIGAFIFGVGCGVMTAVIRIWGNYPEGVSFSILFMNCLVPLIDRYTVRKPFGFKRPEKEVAA